MADHLFAQADLSVRRIEPGDVVPLKRWLNDPRVLEWVYGRDQHFDEDRIRVELVDIHDETTRCIVELHEVPIGFAQFSDLLPDEKEAMGYEPQRRIFGIDQFIGEPELWNQGVGAQLVNAMTKYLCATFHPELIVLDPQLRNERAIHVYDKCGFKPARILPESEHHEGVWETCLLMELRCGENIPE
ncbi:MAG: GNAT family N-acetyltransferase [Actinomycetota bacterium]